MNVVQRIGKNSGVLFISSIISGIFGFFYIMYTARYLGSKDFGVLTFSLAFTGILGVFADFGLNSLSVREISRNKPIANKYFAHISAMRMVLGFITILLIALLVNLLDYPQQTVKIVYIFGIATLITSFNGLCTSTFRSFEVMEYISIGQILKNLLILIGVIFIINLSLTITAFALLYCLCTLVTSGYYLYVLRTKFHNVLLGFSKSISSIDWDFCLDIFKKALPFFLSAIVTVIAFKIDIIMLSKMKGDAVVGWYSAGYVVIEVLIFIPAAFGGAIYPILSNYFLSSHQSLKRIYLYAFKYLSIISIPLAVGITLLADKIVLLVYHSNYMPTIATLQILIWTTPIIFLTYMYGIILASINKQPIALAINSLCMLLNIALNLILIPNLSLFGAAIATVLTTLLSFFLCDHYVTKFVCRIPAHTYLLKPAIASAIMGTIIFILREMNLFLVIFVSIVIYCIVLFLLKTFTQKDRDLFRKMLLSK